MSLNADIYMPSCAPLELVMLKMAANDPEGLKLKGRPQKQTARMLVRRGFGALNKSVTRLTVTPAGRFVLQADAAI